MLRNKNMVHNEPEMYTFVITLILCLKPTESFTKTFNDFIEITFVIL